MRTRLIAALLFCSFAVQAAGAAPLRGFPSAADTRVGVNLPDLRTSGPVFIDAMKQASPWTALGHLTEDRDGNVMLLARGQIAESVIFAGAQYPAGTYTLLYDGSGTFDVSPFSGMVTQRAAGRLSISIRPNVPYGIHLRLSAVDSKNYPHNVRLLLPGYDAESVNGSPFNPDFVSALSRYAVIRFANWTRANSYAVSATWPLRTTTRAFTQAGDSGAAIEYQIALANATADDPWFSIPVGATDYWVENFTRMLATQLDPRLHPLIEYAGDVWQTGTPANRYASMAANNTGLGGDALAWYSRRSIRIFALVQQGFGRAFTRVLSGPMPYRTGTNAAVDREILTNGNAARFADAFAVSGADDPASGESYADTIARAQAMASGAHLHLLASAGGIAETPRLRALASGPIAGAVTDSLLESWHAAGGALFVADGLLDAAGYYASRGTTLYAARHPNPHLQPLRLAFSETPVEGKPLHERPIGRYMRPAPLPTPFVLASRQAPSRKIRRAQTVAAAVVTTPFDINAGGPAEGSYVADTAYTGGALSSGTTATIDTSAVSDPAPMQVYQSARIDDFTYAYQGLTPGALYTVRLHFAEYIWSASGQREFNVAINGTQVLTNFDIYAAAGAKNKAIVEQFNETANANGQIVIVFSDGAVGSPMVQGLELIAGATPTPTLTPAPTAAPETDINSGGPLVGSYLADTDFSGGTISKGTSHTISTTGVSSPAPMQVYQTGRINTFNYTFPGLTPGASYTLRLHFDEYTYNGAGLREFNIAINGTRVLSNFDIYAAAGGKYKAVVEQFSATANASGNVVVSFSKGAVASPIVQGLQLIGGGAAASPTPPPSPTPVPVAGDQLTYHVDNARTGWNQNETQLTTSNVNSTGFGLQQNIAVDGVVMAQPLYVSQYQIGGVAHNLLIVATEHNSVYAFDADTLATLWQVNLGTAQSSADVGCGDVQPEYGINGTPVIVRSGPGSGTIYVVAATEPASLSFHTKLHELSLTDGSDLVTPAEISASAVLSNGSVVTFNPRQQMERTGLLWANNSLYLGIGSHCDAGMTVSTGWMLRYSSALQLLNQFNTVDDSATDLLASIWMTGYPAAVDSSGNIYYVTGNGAFDANTGGKNYGESVVKMSPTLSVLDYFTPSAWSTYNSGDVDFGSGGTMLIPNSTDLVAMGKSALLFLLNQSNLGQESSNDAGALQSYQDTGKPNGVWGGPAYYKDASGAYVYYQLDNSVLQQFAFNGSALSLKTSGTSNGGYGGSSPVVSSNGSTAGRGIVWVVKRGSSISLQAYDASNVATLLFSAGAGSWNNTENNSFLTPLVANGRVYVGSAGNVAVFGLISGTAAMATIKPVHTIPGGMKNQQDVHGFIVARKDNVLTLKRRNGALLQVDITAAVQNRTAGVLALNQAIVAYGTRGSNGVFYAASIGHAGQNPADWGPDSF